MGRARLLAAALAGISLVLAACSSDSGQAATTSGATTLPTTTTSSASTTTTPTTAPSTTAPGTTTAPTGDTTASPAARATVTSYFNTFQLALTAAEADCLAGKLAPASLTSLEDAVATGSEATEAASLDLFGGLVVCQPKSYLDSQIALIQQNTNATQGEAQCVIREANALFAGDAALLALASGDQSTRDWPPEAKEKLRSAIGGCASAELVNRIIESV